jgi:hypothetical protein
VVIGSDVTVRVRVRVGVGVPLTAWEGVNVNKDRGVRVARKVEEGRGLEPGTFWFASGVVVQVAGSWRRVGVAVGISM